jgi:hypothetical protein
MSAPAEPIDIEERLADPTTYEDTIVRIFAKKSQRGMAFGEADNGITYFSAATERRALARAIARSVANGDYRPQPVDLWFLETKGKRRAAHMPTFVDHIVGSTMFQLLSHNARCYGLPGVYSYLPGLTNLGAMQTFAGFVRAHRKREGVNPPPLYVLQSDFMSCSPTSKSTAIISRSASTQRCGASCGRSRRSAVRTVRSAPTHGISSPPSCAPWCGMQTVHSSPGSTASPWGPLLSQLSGIWRSFRWTRRSLRSTASSTFVTTTTSSLPIRISPRFTRQTHASIHWSNILASNGNSPRSFAPHSVPMANPPPKIPPIADAIVSTVLV